MIQSVRALRRWTGIIVKNERSLIDSISVNYISRKKIHFESRLGRHTHLPSLFNPLRWFLFTSTSTSNDLFSNFHTRPIDQLFHHLRSVDSISSLLLFDRAPIIGLIPSNSFNYFRGELSRYFCDFTTKHSGYARPNHRGIPAHLILYN